MISQIVLLSAFVALCASTPRHSSYSSHSEPVPAGFRRSNEGLEAVYRNDLRQLNVNHIARKHQTGEGTAPWYGVPGTGIDFTNSRVLTNTYPQPHQSNNYFDTRRFGSGQQYFGGSTGPVYQAYPAPHQPTYYQPPPPPPPKSEVHYSYGRYYKHHG